MSSSPCARLGEVVRINPGLSRDQRPPDEMPLSFIPMAAVCEKEGAILKREKKCFGEVAKGFTLFAEDDVLFAKITPCMENGKAAIARQLLNGRGAGSTEFFVLRSGSAVLPEFVYYFVRRSSFRAACKANFTGTAGQQRVPKSYLEQVAFPASAPGRAAADCGAAGPGGGDQAPRRGRPRQGPRHHPRALPRHLRRPRHQPEGMASDDFGGSNTRWSSERTL